MPLPQLIDDGRADGRRAPSHESRAAVDQHVARLRRVRRVSVEQFTLNEIRDGERFPHQIENQCIEGLGEKEAAKRLPSRFVALPSISHLDLGNVESTEEFRACADANARRMRVEITGEHLADCRRDDGDDRFGTEDECGESVDDGHGGE